MAVTYVNPHARNPASPKELVASLWRHRELVWQMTRREVVGRYRGSVMGIAWSLFNPILMLAVYTFVFSVVFRARWGTGLEESRVDFALMLFVGMIVHGLFAECINRAPALILANVNYVKKVVFPLEILPWIAMGSALFHALRMVWIPPGFAHGYLTLSDNAIVFYKTTNYYAPQYERTILWSDPALGIRWPLGSAPMMSDKDRQV